MNLYEYSIMTSRPMEIIRLDDYLLDALERSGLENGQVLVYCPHTTAAITINENGDPDVLDDLILSFQKISPRRKEFKHFEGNSHAHFLSSLVGVSENLILDQGQLILGSWQSLYFCEFDGPRRRKFYIKIKKD